jgi:hypothetical protein
LHVSAAHIHPWYAAAVHSNIVRTADADWTTNRAAERFPTSFEGRGTSLDEIQDTASKCQRINIPFTHACAPLRRWGAFHGGFRIFLSV